MQKIILVLAGEMGSGKGAVSEYFESKHGAKKLRFSNFFRDTLGRMWVELSRENMQKLSTLLRSNFGDDILARPIVDDIERCDASLIIIDGVRREEDMRFLRDLEGFVFLYIDANPDARYTRVVLRGENASDTTKTLADFLQDGEAEAEARIRSLRDLADHVISNDGSIEELHEKIDRLYEQLRSA